MVGLRWILSGCVASATLGCGPSGGTDESDASSADDDATGADDDVDDGSDVSVTSGDDDADDDADDGTSADGTSADGTSADDGTDDGIACAEPLDQMTLDQLVLDAGFMNKVPAGGSQQIAVGVFGPGFFEPIDACVEWSIAPAMGAAIDDAGLLSVDATTAPDTVFTVTADIEDGRRILMIDVTVYEPLESSILGYWSEQTQIPCDGSDPFAPEQTILELVFHDTGDFQVTWTPFESYVDYWGTFVFDDATGQLDLTVVGGNYVPEGIDGSGVAGVADGILTLTDIWLGNPSGGTATPACGHTFQ